MLPSAALSAPVRMDIPSEEAARSIPEFARQANVQIIAPVGELHGVKTPAVSGTLEPEAGLKALIAGTGLEIASNDGTVITLRRMPPFPPVRPLAPLPPAEEVVVTGTREETTPLSSLSPVEVVRGSALTATGQTDLRSALAALVPSFISIPSNGTSFSKATRSASLRGLSGNQVLVLVNGQRRHNTALLNNTSGASSGSAAVDLALIPISAVDHVEVLTDGAAAQYGSDAIAGVINIILKGGDSGLDISTELGAFNPGIAQVGGLGASGLTSVSSLAAGLPLLDGFITLSGEFRHVGSTNVTGPLQPPVKAVWQIYAAPGDPREASASRYRQYNEAAPPGDSGSLAYNLEVPLGALTLASHATVALSLQKADGTYRSETNSATIVGVSPPGGYLPVLETRQTDFQVDAGLKSRGQRWKWDLTVSYGENIAGMHVLDGINASFGGSAPQQNFYAGSLGASEFIADFNIQRSFDIGQGWPLKVAGGLEYRTNGFAEAAGEYYSWANGGYVFPDDYPAPNLRGTAAAIGSPFMTGFSPEEAGDHHRSNQTLYLDFAGKPLGLDIDLAGRAEHYSDFGDTISGKLSVRYQIVPDLLAVRATVNNGFRAPLLAEQFTTVANQGPFASPMFPGRWLQLNNYNSIAYTFPQAAALGAKPLKPERSTNVSAGLVLTPAPSFNLTLDAYEIDILDRIYLTGAFNGATNAAVRAVLQAAGQNGYQSIQYFSNIGNTLTQGLDLRASLLQNLDVAGMLALTLGYSLNRQKLTHLDQPLPALASAGLTLVQRPAILNLQSGLPQHIARLTGQWTLAPFAVRLTENFYSQSRASSTASPNDPAFDSISRPAFITDMVLSWDMNDELRISLGANNLFNKRASNIPDIAVPYLSSGASLPSPVNVSPYGIGGAFYYGRLSLSLLP